VAPCFPIAGGRRSVLAYGWKVFMVSRTVVSSVMVLLFAAAAAAGARADQGPRVPSGSPGDPPDSSDVRGTIVGVLRDAETGEPVAAAQVRLREMRRSELSNAQGRFQFLDVRPGRYTVAVERIGYAPTERQVVVAAGQTTDLTVELRPTALELAAVVVTGTAGERAAGDVYQPTSVIGEAELRRRLATSLAATIAHEPGIHQRYNGPAASQPVIRGMGGDRVLVLEDGRRTGDLYATASDHAVTSDPLTAERIEVVRGPAALLYGSSALGGVVNVIREDVPRSLPSRLKGTASAQVESVNRGSTAAATALFPLGRVAVRAEALARRAGDTRTPLGVLESTGLEGYSFAGGASAVTSWGFAGASYRENYLDYGVPGEFGGVLIPGAHAGGVEIETRRRAGRIEAAHLSGVGILSAIELSGSLVHYLHDEIEGRGADDGTAFFGGRFDQLSGGAELRLRHEHFDHLFLRGGAVGLEYRGTDLRTSGSSPGTRSATEGNVAVFGYEELGVDRFRLQAGLRYDWTSISPYFDDPIVVGERQIPVRDRDFGSFSGSLAALLQLGPGWTGGVNVARAFRRPAIEELFSDGPHLADFSFDIGNPELDPEVGHGVDVFLRGSLPRLEVEASVFGNRISNYIYYEYTGEVDPRFQRYPVFQARGDDALFVGAEGRVQWEAARNLVLDGTVSGVRATRTATDDPLPDIPPLTASARARYEAQRWFASLGWDGSASQDRVPRPIQVNGGSVRPQQPTAGAGLLNAGVGLRWAMGDRFHTLTLQADNLLDTEWRDHLSRIKDVAPQPGRNIQLLYRLSF
jgi:iron complex outermembrane recepter protein